MLGVRHYNSCYIDLFQKDPSETSRGFVSDVFIKSEELQLENFLTVAANNKTAHLSIEIKSPKQAQDILVTIKKELPPTQKFPQRISLILEDDAQYQSAQEYLFATFPE